MTEIKTMTTKTTRMRSGFSEDESIIGLKRACLDHFVDGHKMTTETAKHWLTGCRARGVSDDKIMHTIEYLAAKAAREGRRAWMPPVFELLSCLEDAEKWSITAKTGITLDHVLRFFEGQCPLDFGDAEEVNADKRKLFMWHVHLRRSQREYRSLNSDIYKMLLKICFEEVVEIVLKRNSLPRMVPHIEKEPDLKIENKTPTKSLSELKSELFSGNNKD